MKLSIQRHDGFANTPEFAIDYTGVAFDAPLIIPMEDDCSGHGRAWFLSFNYDLSVLNYRTLCEFRTDGNTHYGYPEGGYMSGWSSRASCINKELGYRYVDVSGRGVELDKLLYLIQNKYVGQVFVSSRETRTDKEYIVEPYFHDMHDKYDTSGDYLIIHTVDPEFIEQCLLTAIGVNHNLKVL